VRRLKKERPRVPGHAGPRQRRRGRRGDEPDSSLSPVRRGEGETRQAGPAYQRERERRGKAWAAWAGTGEMGPARGERKGRRGRAAAGWAVGKERREKREVGRLG
jgi:hypothetical protein